MKLPQIFKAATESKDEIVQRLLECNAITAKEAIVLLGTTNITMSVSMSSGANLSFGDLTETTDYGRR